MNSETQADIIREMRNRADTVIEGRVITVRNFVPQETVEDWADRIEAARKRELGDAAALREALEAMLDECCNLCDVPNQMTESGHACNWRDRWSGCQSKAIDKARAALATPPRNCDVGTVAEQYKRFRGVCDSKDARQCSCCELRGLNSLNCSRDKCLARWEQMPYEEGDAK